VRSSSNNTQPNSEPSEDNTNDNTNEIIEISGKQITGAAAAGSILGLTIGPTVALLSGATAAGLAIGRAGTIAQNSGDAMVTLDGTHRISDRSVDAMVLAGAFVVQKLMEYNYPTTTTTTTTNNTKRRKSVKIVDKKQIGGAAVAGTILGLTIFTPIVTLLTGATVASLAGVNKSTIGDVARASGDILVVVHGKVREVEETHCVVDGTKTIARVNICLSYRSDTIMHIFAHNCI